MADDEPRIIDLLRGEAEETWSSPFGTTGRIFSGEGIEAVWVRKEREEIDPGWFSQRTVDLLLVINGLLRVEFAGDRHPATTMHPGQMLILPAETRCRAYRWPRDAEGATLFLAVYPQEAIGSHA